MNTKHAGAVLLIIFLATFGLRLALVLQTDHFSGDEAYFTLRQIEHIGETGLPLFDDPLSYGGRHLVFPALFHYVLAFFDLFLPLVLVAKIIPNLFASILVFIIYKISMKITKDVGAALFTASLSAFIPIFLGVTINSISVYSLLIPYVFYMIYCFMNLSDRKYVNRLIFMTFLLPLLHVSGVVLAIGLLIYLFFIKLECLELKRIENEVVVFMLFVIVWLAFIIYKKALLFHGPAVIWQNIPSQLLALASIDVFVLDVLYKVGYIPLVYGIYTIYEYIFHKKERDIYLLIGFASASFLMIVLRLISLDIGLLFFAAVMVVLFSQAYVDYVSYINKLKFKKFRAFFILAFYVTFLTTSFIPSMALSIDDIRKVPMQDKIDAMEWLKDNTNESAVVLADISEGHLITGIAGRRNVLDSHFLLIDDAQERLIDVERLYATKFETDAVSLLNKYEVSYIVVSEEIKKKYNFTELAYVEDERCFSKVYDNGLTIYESKCSLEKG